MAEICIPTHCVPADILNRLKEIVLTLQTDSSASPGSTQACTSKEALINEAHRDKNSDETDDYVTSGDMTSDVIHVTEPKSGVKEKKQMKQIVHITGLSQSPQQQQQEQKPTHDHYSFQQQYCSATQFQKSGPLLHSHSEVNFTDRRTPSPTLHRFSPFKSISSVEGQTLDEDRRLLHNRSPRMQTRHEDLSLQSGCTCPSRQLWRNPFPSFTQTSEPRNSSGEELTSFHDDVIGRVFPTPPLSAPPDIGARSPKLLTPPETPEGEGKRKVKDIFTFDDLACAQERMRQNVEKMRQLQDQCAPRRDVMRHPTPCRTSTPSTPSYRRAEIPSSPGVHPSPWRVSPVEYPHPSRTCTPSPPQTKKTSTSEGPSSPGPPPHGLARGQEDFFLQRRDPVSPLPRKRLSFDEDGLPLQAHTPLAQRARNFDLTGSPYSVPSSRHALPGPESVFPGSSLATANCDGAAGLYFSNSRSFAGCETVDSANRMALPPARCPIQKRKRPSKPDSAFDEDGNDDFAFCTCAVMEKNFLQMAECAYKRIRRMDTSPGDFERFRDELAQTNDILRESMGLMKHIREICDHGKRPRY